METSVFIAKIVAVYYVAVGLGVLLNASFYRKAFNDMLKNSAFIFLGGIMALVIGFLIVNFHNVWVKDWTVLITILGWLALLKGLLMFLIPKPFLSFSKVFIKNLWFVVIFALALGGVLGYFGFFA